MNSGEIISWLLEGDVSIRYQTYRDLLGAEKPGLRNKIASEGWGKKFLKTRQPDGYWGRGFYQPKWTSSHYTLLDLKNLSISPDNGLIKGALQKILKKDKGPDGGVKPIGSDQHSDVCVNGMFLNYACYFGAEENDLKSVADLLLAETMADGGFNCHSNRKGAVHSSLHSTLSVLEGILEYERNGYTYRLKEFVKARHTSHEFILMHRLFRSDKTGEVINPNFLKFHYPCRWYYDILKAMDYFQSAGVKYDKRMGDALGVILNKRTAQGQWKLPSMIPGLTHFKMEEAGVPSRWNTLRALRVLKYYKIQKINHPFYNNT